MDTQFIYYKPVTGRHFIGRQTDCNIFSNLLRQGENVVIDEPARTGKASMMQNVFFQMRIGGETLHTAEFSFLNVRTAEEAFAGLGSAILRTLGNEADELAELASQFLAGTHFVFDREIYGNGGRPLSLNWAMEDSDARAVLELPYRIATARGQKVYVVLHEFQNILKLKEGERYCRMLEDVFASRTEEDRKLAAYVLSGSQVNAMKDIFEHRKMFFRQVERVALSKIDTKEIVDYVIKGFLSSGKVIDKELMLGACKLFDNNIWYINHFVAICDSFSKGYLMEPVLMDALDALISIHQPRFEATMNDLTTFQVNLLKAIVDGYTRFSSAQVIRDYGLNSSANVRRLKDALCKKEIVTGDDLSLTIIDPLFEYWIKKYYFRKREA